MTVNVVKLLVNWKAQSPVFFATLRTYLPHPPALILVGVGFPSDPQSRKEG